MAAISKLTPGKFVYEIIGDKCGTSRVMRRTLAEIYIIEVDATKEKVLARRGLENPKWFLRNSFKQWKVARPEPKCTVFGMPSY
jgi:hypothetical protein